jgi:hypothetical protein
VGVATTHKTLIIMTGFNGKKRAISKSFRFAKNQPSNWHARDIQNLLLSEAWEALMRKIWQNRKNRVDCLSCMGLIGERESKLTD